jgi:GH15 family glucan-1,4-alpha-glucosidase
MDFALIGNCQTAALVDRRGRIIWWCFPRFDSDPVFSRLLAGDEEKGFCEVALADLVEVKTQYLRNTAVVETILVDVRGGQVRVVDFAPLFDLYGRTYRAPQIVRRIEPIAGLPRITIKVRPTCNYGERVGEISAGSHHIRYISGGAVVRLTTDAPISYIVAETGFPLHRTINLIFGQDDPVRDAIDDTCREFLDRTCDHWREWTRRLNVPFEWQSAVVRAAITLRLCAYEDTGGIVAAHTTSIPEAPGRRAIGTTAIAGCATPSSSFRRSTASAPRI